MKITIVGVGYVGLPLACSLSEHYELIGYDTNTKRIEQLKNGEDVTLQTLPSEFKNVVFTSEASAIKKSDIFIVTVPTPVTDDNIPDLTLLEAATVTIAQYMAQGSTVVYESTVFPGATEGICVPLIEKLSGYQWKKDFFVAYSPERINPSDRINTLENTIKVYAGDTAETAEKVKTVYQSIITAGLHNAGSIKVAEASKVLENIQRDVNIALMNEFTIYCHSKDIDSKEVLSAAKTKWNFLDFHPGLVGGHCIGVDPYYLLSSGEKSNLDLKLIRTARLVNEHVLKYVADKISDFNRNMLISKPNIVLFGATFKPNCADIRNSKILEIDKLIKIHNRTIKVYDPFISPDDLQSPYELMHNISKMRISEADCIILAVNHDVFHPSVYEYILDTINPNTLLIIINRMQHTVQLEKRTNTWCYS